MFACSKCYLLNKIASKRYRLLLYALILIVIILVPIGISDIDGKVYYLYAKSFIQDGDLNLINQALPIWPHVKQAIILTPTYNLVDQHYYGPSVFLWPFVLLEKTLQFSMQGLATAVLTYIVGLFTILITYCQLNSLNIKTKHKVIAMMTILATPFPLYWLAITNHADIIACFFSATLLFFALRKNISTYHCILYALLIGVSIQIKPDLIFICGAFIVSFLVRSSEKIKHILIFFIIISFYKFPTIINDYIKYGSWTVDSYLSLFNSNYFLLKDVLINPFNGLLVKTPIILILIPGLFFLPQKFRHIIPFYVLFIAKIILTSFTYSTGLDEFNRQIIVDMPLIVLTASILIVRFDRYRTLVNLTIASILISIVIAQWHGIQCMLEEMRDAPFGEILKIKLLMFAIMFFILQGFKLNNSKKVIPFLCLLYLLMYSSITFSNYKTNFKNAADYAIFPNIILGNHATVFGAYDNIGSLVERFHYCQAFHDIECQQQAISTLRHYLNTLRSHVTFSTVPTISAQKLILNSGDNPYLK